MSPIILASLYNKIVIQSNFYYQCIRSTHPQHINLITLGIQTGVLYLPQQKSVFICMIFFYISVFSYHILYSEVEPEFLKVGQLLHFFLALNGCPGQTITVRDCFLIFQIKGWVPPPIVHTVLITRSNISYVF